MFSLKNMDVSFLDLSNIYSACSQRDIDFIAVGENMRVYYSITVQMFCCWQLRSYWDSLLFDFSLENPECMAHFVSCDVHEKQYFVDKAMSTKYVACFTCVSQG